jgi:hypothetical protein
MEAEIFSPAATSAAKIRSAALSARTGFEAGEWIASVVVRNLSKTFAFEYRNRRGAIWLKHSRCRSRNALSILRLELSYTFIISITIEGSLLIGYARIPQDTQSIDLQINALIAAGCEKLFSDTISGSRNDRPGLKQALEFVGSGDSICVWRLDRLGRSLFHLIQLMQDLERRGDRLSQLDRGDRHHNSRRAADVQLVFLPHGTREARPQGADPSRASGCKATRSSGWPTAIIDRREIRRRTPPAGLGHTSTRCGDGARSVGSNDLSVLLARG